MRRKSIKKVATLAVTGALACTNAVGVVASEIPVDENQGTEAEPQELVKAQCNAQVFAKVSYKGENAPALVGDDFTFQLKDAQGNVVDTATNNADGTVTFNLTCDTEGLFGYTIEQVQGTDENITYDTTITNVAVNVAPDEAGNLAATVDYGLPDGEDPDPTGVFQANDFVNTFGTEAEDGDADAAQSGDDMTLEETDLNIPKDGGEDEAGAAQSGEDGIMTLEETELSLPTDEENILNPDEEEAPAEDDTAVVPDAQAPSDSTTAPAPTPTPLPNYNTGIVHFPVPTSYVYLDGGSVSDSNLNLEMYLSTFKQTRTTGATTSNNGKVAWADNVINGTVKLTGKVVFIIQMVRADRTDDVLYDNQYYSVEYTIYNGEIQGEPVIKDRNEKVVAAPVFNCIQTGYGKDKDTSTTLGAKVDCTKGSTTQGEYTITGTLKSGTPNNVSDAGNNFSVGNNPDGTFPDSEIIKKFPTTPGQYDYEIVVKPTDTSKTVPITPAKRTLTVYVNPNKDGGTDYTFQVDGKKGDLSFKADDKGNTGTDIGTGKLNKLTVTIKDDKGASLGEDKATATFTPTADPSKAFTKTNDAAGEFNPYDKLPTTPGKYEYTVSVGLNGQIPGYTNPVVSPASIKVIVYVAPDGTRTFDIDGDKPQADFMVSESKAGNEADFKLFSKFLKNALSSKLTMKNGDKDMKGITGDVTVKVSVGGALSGRVDAINIPVTIKDGSVTLDSVLPDSFITLLDKVPYSELKGKTATLKVDVTPLELKGSDGLTYKTSSSGSDFITITFPEKLPAPDANGNFNLPMTNIDGAVVTKASDVNYAVPTELTDAEKTDKFVDAMSKLFSADFRLSKTAPTVSNATDTNQGILDGSVTATTKVKVTFDDFLKSMGVTDYEATITNNQGKGKENTLSVFDKFKDVLKAKGYKAFEGKEFTFSIEYTEASVKGSDSKNYKRVNDKGTWKVRFDKPDSVTVISAPGVYATSTDSALKFTGFYQQDGELTDAEKTELFANTLSKNFTTQFRLSKTVPQASDYKSTFGILDGSVKGSAKVNIKFDDALNALGIKNYETTLNNFYKDAKGDVTSAIFAKYADTIKTLGWKQFEGKEVSFEVEFPEATIKGSDGKTYYANNAKGTWKVKFEAPDKLTVISHPTLLDDGSYSAFFSEEDPSKVKDDKFKDVKEELKVSVDNGKLKGGEIEVTLKPDKNLKDLGATDVVAKNDKDGKLDLSGITIPKKEGTYTYDVTYKDPDNLECTENIKHYQIIYTVKKNEKGEYTYEKTFKKDDKEWDGSRHYKVKDTGDEKDYADAKITLTGKVNLKNGKDKTKFTFVLSKGTTTISTVESTTDGEIKFPQLKLNKEGTYTLQVTQTAGTDKNITYDNKPVTVVIKVTKDDEKKAYAYKITYSKNGEAVKGITFNNTYNSSNNGGNGNGNGGINQGTANTVVTLVRSQALESYLNQISGETGRVTSNQHTMSFQLTATNKGSRVQAMTYVRAKVTGGMTLATSALGGKMVSVNGDNYVVWEVPTIAAGASSALSATLNVPANSSDGRTDYGIEIEYLPLNTADSNYMQSTNWVSADSLTFYQTGKGTGATAAELAQNAGLTYNNGDGSTGNGGTSLLSTVATGDNTPLAAMLSLFGLSAAGVLGGLIYKKKRDGKDEE